MLDKNKMYVMPWDNEEDEEEYEIVFDGMDFKYVKARPEQKVMNDFEDFINEEFTTGCKHEWRKDSFFFTKVYETCKKCGAKKEDC